MNHIIPLQKCSDVLHWNISPPHDASSWNAERRNVWVNDVVMMADNNAVRGIWIIGRVNQVYPGPDEKVKNMSLRTASNEYRRPITKIAVIYPAEGYPEDFFRETTVQ